MDLNPKQSAFIDEYLIDLNGTQAAIRAGYSKKTAESQASTLLRNPKVQAEVTRRKEQRSQRTKIDADYVLHRLSEIDQMDVLDILEDSGNVKPVRNWPKIWRQFISGFDVNELFHGAGEEREIVGLLKKIKWPDKVKNLELIGRHVNVQAFKDKIESDNKLTFQNVPEKVQSLIDKLSGGKIAY